ncbi:MAG: hypothetical protein M1497_01975 [Nitrospirae bacterium]|nr:hypothetical protein [Nitrospirota bacterium]
MLGRSLEKINGIYVIALLLTLSVMLPLNLFGQESNAERPNRVEIRDSRVSVDVQDAEIADVLKEIERGSGVKITVAQELAGKKATAQFTEMDIEDALKILLGNDFHVMTFLKDQTNPEKTILKEVKAGGPPVGSKPLKGKMLAISIPYGLGPREVGAEIGDEGASIGPKSFAVDNKGEIFICDTVNGRIQVFSRAGGFLFTIPLKEHLPVIEGNKRIYSGSLDDIVIDESGLICIYDGMVNKLYQYDDKGNVITAIDLDRSLRGSGPMHIVKDEIYEYVCDSAACGDILVGRILGNRLVEPAAEEQKSYKEAGKTGRSGKKYMTRPATAERGLLEIRDESTNSIEVVSFPLSGIQSIKFLGEDREGNFYMESGRALEKGIREVHKFNAQADYLQSMTLPTGNINFWAVREYALDKYGSIYQFLPEKSSLKLNIFVPAIN